MDDLLKLYRQKAEGKRGCLLATAINSGKNPKNAESICGENCPFERCIEEVAADNTDILLAHIYQAIGVKNEKQVSQETQKV